MNNFRCY